MNESEQIDWNKLNHLIEELVKGQQAKMVKCGQRINPKLTPEDMLQPNDYPELENHPHFRYEEGTLAGIQSVQMAVWAIQKTFLHRS